MDTDRQQRAKKRIAERNDYLISMVRFGVFIEPTVTLSQTNFPPRQPIKKDKNALGFLPAKTRLRLVEP